MSRNFGAAVSFGYTGIPNVAPIKIKSVSGQSVPLSIVWANYTTFFSNVAVRVDLSPSSVSTPLGQIRSVYIDNMGSANPVYVQFPDTGYTVVAKENSAGWFPVYTNQFKFSIIALGINTSNIPIASVLVTNIAIEASIDVEIDSTVAQFLSSPSNARIGTFQPGNSAPALGDQFLTISLNPAINNTFTSNLFGTPYASGEFVYITSVYFTAQMEVPGTNVALFFESTGLAGIFWQGSIGSPVGVSIPFTVPLQIQAQWKLDGSQTWRVRSAILAGVPSGDLNFNFSYTINP
jgi:hypothetical protein